MTARPRPLRRSRFGIALVVLVLAAVFVTLPDGVGAAPKKKSRAKSKTAAVAKGPAKVEVAVLYTADLHGHLLPWNYDTGKPDPELGLSKIATLVKKVRSETPRSILVDAGDCIQGTPLPYVHAVGADDGVPGTGGRPDPQMACMNAMGYEAFAIGNHEYNFGLDVLQKAQSEATFPWLSANTLKTDTPGAAAYQSYLVKVIDGVRVGFLGLTTPGVPHWDDPPNWAGLTFEDPLETAKRMVPIMRERERCDAVIIVCHMGLEEDANGRAKPNQMPNENRVLALARGVPGIDAIIMGHTHVRVESRIENGVLLTQSGRWADGLGRLDLTFDRQSNGRYKLGERKGRVYDVDEAVASDPEIEAIAKPYHDATETYLSTVIAQAADTLDGRDARIRDNALHEIVDRAQLKATGADVSLSAMFNPRAHIMPGPITVRDVFEIYPYENTLAAIELSGADMKAALEHSSRYYMPYDFGRQAGPAVNPDIPGYNFDTVEGLSYTLDLTRPAGERIRDLRFKGEPLAADRMLKVAVNNYRVNGGGGYTMLKNGREVSTRRVPARSAVVAYMREQGTIARRTDGNWRLAPEWVDSPGREPIERLVRRGVIPPDSALTYRLDAPLTHRRLADWVRLLGVPEPLGPAGESARKKQKQTPVRIDPASTVPLSRAIEWSANALPAGERARATAADDPFGLAEGRPADRPLTVAEGAAVLADAVFPRLTVLHMTDFHGALLPGAVERTSQKAWGGAAVFAAYVARERALNPKGTILTDGGDWMQGTAISNLRFGRPVIDLMNRLDVDAAAIGNHEFDWNVDTLRARMADARFTPLGANWFDRTTDRRMAGIAPWTIETRRGLAVGIIGVCTEDTPHTTLPMNVKDFEFKDAGKTAASLVDSVRAAGASLFVVIGHVAGRQDSTGKVSGELADVARAVPGELAVFGGHSHNRLLGEASGVPAMIAGSSGQYLGRLDAVVDRRADQGKGAVVPAETRTRMIPTYAADVRPDPATLAFVEQTNAAIAPITGRVLGTAEKALGRSRAEDSALGNWIADAMREATNVDFAFQNPGGIRTELDAGPVTVGEVYAIMPFDNRIATVQLTGAQVKAVLENGVSPTTCIQVSGLTFTFDPAKVRGERVSAVKTAAGVPLDPAATYAVAANDFMAQGGDGFSMFAEGKDLTVTGILVREAMEKDLEKRTARGERLDATGGRRIKNLGADSSTATER